MVIGKPQPNNNMGGNAFQEAIRIPSREVYKALFQRVAYLLSGVTPPSKMAVAKSLTSKTDFGDLDILIAALQPPGFQQALQSVPDFLTHKVNGKTVSALVRLPSGGGPYQVDFEFLGPISGTQFWFALDWYSYGGLGNVIGYLVRSLGFRLRPTGVFFDLKHRHVFGGSSEEVLGQFNLGMGWFDLLEWLGVDLSLTGAPFKTWDPIFEAVTRSPYFGKVLLTRATQNRINYDRDRKRPIYQALLDYVESHKDTLPDLPSQTKVRCEELERFGLSQTILTKAADSLLGQNLRKRIVIPPPSPDEYSGFSGEVKRIRDSFTPLELLLKSSDDIQDKVRQLSPDRAIWK